MITINKGQPNTITLTLTEKVSLEEPYFLFVFTHDHSRQKAYCVASDISEYTHRYNQFTVTETALSPDSQNGEVALAHEGYWKYEVYEQQEPDDLDPDNATTLLESGKLLVTGAADPDHTYIPDNEDINYIYEE